MNCLKFLLTKLNARNYKLTKKFSILLLTFCCLFLSSCGLAKSIENRPNTTEEINNLELSEECGENTVTKINRFLPGFYHEDNWYVPTSMRIIMLEDIDYKEDIILRDSIRSDWVEGLKGCMIEGDVSEGSYYNVPYNSRVILDTSGKYYLCDRSHWCAEMSIYDGIDRAPTQIPLNDILDDLDKVVFPDNTAITQFKEIKSDIYLPGTAYVFNNFAIYTKSDPLYFYTYKYIYVPGTDFITVSDPISNKSFVLFLYEEDVPSLEITQKMIEEAESQYNQEIEQVFGDTHDDNHEEESVPQTEESASGQGNG